MIPATTNQPLPVSDILIEIDRMANEIYVMHERKERRFPVHNHLKGQLTYVEGGIAYVYFPAKTFIIPARHFIWIPCGQDHFLQAKNSEVTIIRNIYYPVSDDTTNAGFFERMGIYPASTVLHEMIGYTEQWNGSFAPGSVNHTFLSAIQGILPASAGQSLPIILPTTQNERLRPVVLYLRGNISHELTLENVSRRFNMAERTLSRMFRTVMGISFLQYVKQLRMVTAVEMMLQTDYTMSQIAYECGYKSLSAFSNTFWEMTKKRPSDFAGNLR